MPVEPRLDRLQLASWAILRSQQSGIAGSQSLAGGGQLGASQAGVRVIYNLNRQLAFTARTSSEVGRRGGEVAAGVRVQPVGNIPLWLTAERRQAIGRYGGGRNAFALFFEGGLYERPLPLQLSLDAYLQGGVVGVHSRDPFVDGGVAATRPVYRQFSAGFGIWGGAQPKLYRVDAGPGFRSGCGAISRSMSTGASGSPTMPAWAREPPSPSPETSSQRLAITAVCG
jgi:hypothetical protein